MIKLTSLLRRREGMSREQFDRYWREEHGPLIRRTRSGSYVLRYLQHPAAGTGGRWDGVTEQWFASMDAFWAALAEEDYRLIEADLPNFLDVEAIEFVLTEEPRTVIEPDGR